EPHGQRLWASCSLFRRSGTGNRPALASWRMEMTDPFDRYARLRDHRVSRKALQVEFKGPELLVKWYRHGASSLLSSDATRVAAVVHRSLSTRFHSSSVRGDPPGLGAPCALSPGTDRPDDRLFDQLTGGAVTRV
ncbi:MAG: hypothetical protein Q8O76_04595, partial [Chloroflexota bacterium]|nr:hypothetical protein [Chloroflexota bacterium]